MQIEVCPLNLVLKYMRLC